MNSHLVNEWNDHSKRLETRFSSSAILAEARLQETLQATTESLGRPNIWLTSVALDLLRTIVRRFGSYTHIGERLLDEVEAALYLNPGENNPEPFFSAKERKEHEVRVTERKLRDAERAASNQERQLYDEIERLHGIVSEKVGICACVHECGATLSDGIPALTAGEGG